MNWLDLVLLLFIGAGAWKGWRQGLILSLLHMAAVLVGFVVASRYASRLADILDRNWHLTAQLAHAILQYLGGRAGAFPAEEMAYRLAATVVGGVCFLFLFLLAERIFFFSATALTSLVKPLGFPLIDRAAGLFLGALWGFLFSAIVFFLVQKVAEVSLPPHAVNPLAEVLAASQLAPYYQGFWQAVKAFSPVLRQGGMLVW
ncbi:CvpA family protein [Ammonifex thiophilus]|uniref:CvpA family protein n=1 Tax=Ammonifex thiophilus TaxID=444093 RepID=A0A3D8P7A8_9THEO|nr:CvpA family protein [Ammonifex thiophilus]RDV84587.1 CvpA family protein [Ammonifex thiophilus]